MEKKNHDPDRPAAEPADPRRDLPAEPLPLGAYPVFDDDLPRDGTFDNFAAPDLRDLRLYPWGLE